MRLRNMRPLIDLLPGPAMSISIGIMTFARPLSMMKGYVAEHWYTHVKFECGEPEYSSMSVGVDYIYRGGLI